MNSPHFLDQSPEDFLRNIWGKRPHFMASANIDLSAIALSPDELAGMAQEDFCESRVIIHDKSADSWQLKQGPFADEELTTLPKQEWTLLVQDVDKFIPEVAALLDTVNFLPSYWLDDVMVSYATKGGSVGAHLDRYHVFLVQFAGHRRWQVEDVARETEDYVPGMDVRLLKTFEPTSTFETKPGDILYVPPLCAHYGVAMDDDCMTLSIGFRAPSQTQLLGSFAGYLAMDRDQDELLIDDAPQATATPGRINPRHIELAKQLMRDAMNDERRFKEWFGKYLSEPKFRLDAELDPKPTSDTLLRDENCRAFYNDSDGCQLFVDGRKYDIPAGDHDLARALCNQREIKTSGATPAWLVELIRDGFWYWT